MLLGLDIKIQVVLFWGFSFFSPWKKKTTKKTSRLDWLLLLCVFPGLRVPRRFKGDRGKRGVLSGHVGERKAPDGARHVVVGRQAWQGDGKAACARGRPLQRAARVPAPSKVVLQTTAWAERRQRKPEKLHRGAGRRHRVRQRLQI